MRKIVHSMILFFFLGFFFTFLSLIFGPSFSVVQAWSCGTTDCGDPYQGPNFCSGDYVKNYKYTPQCDLYGDCTFPSTQIAHSDFCTYGCSVDQCNPAPSTCDGTTYPQLCNNGTGVQTCKGKGGTYDPGCNPDCTACQTKYKCSGTSCVADGTGAYTSSTCSDSCNPSPTCDASLCGAWTNAGCGAGGCAPTQRQQTRTCPSGSTCSTSQCVSDSSCGTTPPSTPAPGIPPTPTISTSPSLSCIYQGYSGSGFTISWGSSTYAVTVVDISTYSDFRGWYSKSVRGTSTTAGGSTTADGFGLTFNPGTIYYVRLWDDFQHSATAAFTTPVACVTLSGYVRTSSGAGLANVPLTDYSCQGSGAPLKWSPTTSASGYYSIADVAAGTGFCLRVAPTLTTYTTSYTRTSGTYEWQIAGWTNAYTCSQFGSTSSQCAYDVSTDNSYNFTYTPTLSASCSVSPVSTPAGGSATWTAYPAGGSGTYTYSWSGTDGLSGGTSSVAKVYSAPGVKTGAVTVTSAGQSITVNCSNSLTVAPAPLTVSSCTVFPNPVAVSNPVTWTVSVSGGIGPYTYSWSGTDGLSSAVFSISKIYTTAGPKTATVTVASSDGQSISDYPCPNLTVMAGTTPWIQILNGDVHSNGSIIAPGGP